MSVDAETFKQVFSNWATGVTIVTSRHGDRVMGMTVSAFNEVSLVPPLCLVCADKASNTNELIQRSRAFSVSILAEGQQELSNRFASKQEEHRRFDGLACADGRTGCPRIPGALAHLDCAVEQAVDAGDHWVYIARIEDAVLHAGVPLLYCRGRYHALQDGRA
jgi:flavin reductase (DIM6/NTAB) family NADH-FMN oxidoreductase RutF